MTVEVRKRTLYRKLILRKWRLKLPNDLDVIVDVVLDCLVYACKTFNGHSAGLCFTCVRRCIVIVTVAVRWKETLKTHTNLPEGSRTAFEGAGTHLRSFY